MGKREGLKGFTLHLFTDGLTEAMNPEEEEYGEQRFKELAEKIRNEILLNFIKNSVWRSIDFLKSTFP